MELWMLLVLLLIMMVVASVVPARTPPPQVIVLQAIEPPREGGMGCFPLILFVGVVLVALALL